MHLPSFHHRVAVAALAVFTAACAGSSGPSSPVGPSIPAAGTAAAASAHPTPEQLVARGWTCFTPPVPDRIVCSHPNQGFPVVGTPPPADRPASYQLWVFNGAGVFTGTELLIRTDLYQGQICESTREPYVFVPIIGYYECIHSPGR